MRPLPPIRLENGAPTGRNFDPIQRWPDRDGYRAAERYADISMMPADEVTKTSVRWLWPDRIPIGHLTLVAGEPGSGKSFWMADLAARITFARPWPYLWHGQETGQKQIQNPKSEIQNPIQGSVVYVNSDDSFLDVQRPRLAAAEAQLPMIGLIRRMPPGSRFQQFNSVGPIEERLKSLKTAIQEAGDCKLAIVDDLARFVRDGLGKVCRSDLMLALESLKCLAAECRVAMIVVWRLERTARATARHLETFLPAAATAWLVGGDPYGRDTRWVVSLKNQFGPPPEPMAFHIADNRVVWDTPPENVPADVMVAFVRKSERRLEREHAGRWALARLADGPVEANELFDDAEAFGFSRRTVRRALVDLGLKPRKLGNDGPWVWKLAAEASKAEGRKQKAEEGSGFRVQGSEKDAGADGEERGSCEVAAGQGDEADVQCKMQNAKCKSQNDASGNGGDTEDLSSHPKSKIENAKSTRPEGEAGEGSEADGHCKMQNANCKSQNDEEEGSGFGVQGSGKDAGADGEERGSCEVAAGQGDEADVQCKMQNAKCKSQNDASGNGGDTEDLSSHPKSKIENPKSTRPEGEAGEASEGEGHCKLQNAKCKSQNDASGNGGDTEDLSSKTEDLRPDAFTQNPKSKIQNRKSEDGQLETEKQIEPATASGADELDDDPEFDPIIPEEGKVADNDEGQVVIVVLRPTAPGAECLVEDGQLG